MAELLLTFQVMKSQFFRPFKGICQYSIACFLVLGVVAWGCQTNDNTNEDSNQESPKSPMNTTTGDEIPAPSTKMSPSGRNGMKQKNEENRVKKEAYSAENENLLSPYRYVISVEEFSIFARLVQASSHSKHIHSAGVTLLSPTDRAFNEEFPDWKMLLRSGDQDALDDFVGHHVLEGVMTYDDFKLMDSHPTMLGDDVMVNTLGGVFANDAHVRSGFVETNNGNLIALDGIAYTPGGWR